MTSVHLSLFAALAPAMPERGPLNRGPPVACSSVAYDLRRMKPTSKGRVFLCHVEGCTMTSRSSVTLRLLISGGILAGALQLFAGAVWAQNTIVCNTQGQRIYAELCKGVAVPVLGGASVHFTRISKTCLRLGVPSNPGPCGDGAITEVNEAGIVQSGKYTVECTSSTRTFGQPVSQLSLADQFDSTKTFVTSLGTDSKVGCTEKSRGNFFSGHRGFFEIGPLAGNLEGSCADKSDFSSYQISCEAHDSP
jgi:hypothetical protein